MHEGHPGQREGQFRILWRADPRVIWEMSKWTSTGRVSCCCQCRKQEVDSSCLAIVVHEKQHAELDDPLVNVRSGSPPGIRLPVAEISVGFPMSGDHKILP